MSVWERLGGIQGKAAAVLVIVFLAGGGTGYFAGRWQALQERIEAEAARPARFSRYRKRRRPNFMRRLETDLGLEAEQLKRVRATLRQHHNQMRTIRKQMKPQVKEILEKARREIRVLLTTDQQRTFDTMVSEYDERRRKRKERWMRRKMENRER